MSAADAAVEDTAVSTVVGCRSVMSCISASRYNPALRAFSDAFADADKKSKVVIVAVMRKMITTLNAMLRDNTAWQLKST